MREYFCATACASVRTSIVLPRPGAPSSSTCPPASRAIRTPSTTSAWPTMALEISRRTSAIFSARNSACDPRGWAPIWPSVPTGLVMNPSYCHSCHSIGSPRHLTIRCSMRAIVRVLEITLYVEPVTRRNIFLLGAVDDRVLLRDQTAIGQLCRARLGGHFHPRLLLVVAGLQRHAVGNGVHGPRGLILAKLL